MKSFTTHNHAIGVVLDIATAKGSLFVCERLSLGKFTFIVKVFCCGHMAWVMK